MSCNPFSFFSDLFKNYSCNCNCSCDCCKTYPAPVHPLVFGDEGDGVVEAHQPTLGRLIDSSGKPDAQEVRSVVTGDDIFEDMAAEQKPVTEPESAAVEVAVPYADMSPLAIIKRGCQHKYFFIKTREGAINFRLRSELEKEQSWPSGWKLFITVPNAQTYLVRFVQVIIEKEFTSFEVMPSISSVDNVLPQQGSFAVEQMGMAQVNQAMTICLDFNQKCEISDQRSWINLIKYVEDSLNHVVYDGAIPVDTAVFSGCRFVSYGKDLTANLEAILPFNLDSLMQIENFREYEAPPPRTDYLTLPTKP